MRPGIFSLVFILFCLAGFQARAHDPKLVSVQLIMQENKWLVKTVYSGKSLEAAVQAYFKNSELTFKNDSLFKVYIDRYFRSHLAVEINKSDKLEFAEYNVDLNEHATSVTYTVRNRPAFIGFIKLDISVGKENSSSQIYFILKEGAKNQTFRLTPGNYELKISRDVNGKYSQVK